MAMFKNYFVDDEDVVPEPPMKTADDYSAPELEDIYSGLRSAGVSPEAGQRSVDMTRRLAGMVVPPPEGELPSDLAEIQAANKAPEARNIPTKSASVRVDAPVAVTAGQPPVTADRPAGKPDSSGKMGMPVPSSEGAGGDASERDLYLARLAAQNAAGFGGMGAGKNIDMGIADTLGERLKQVQALRAKREEQGLTDTRERANNRAQVDYLISRFPDRAEDLQKLYGMTGKPNFSQMLRVEEQVALDKAKKEDIGAKAEDRAKTQEYRAGTLDLKRDIAKDNRDYRAVQAGLKQAELNLRAAENERKATGSAEPSDKERSAFQASMKPAENTAVSLKDADNLNSLSTGMLVSGKPPPFLTQADIVSFVGIPPFEGAMRSRLAQSNPQAFDLLTQMARLKTMVGHEYFGSALSPAEAERQRQFLDFGVTDTPDSIARKMKSYHDTLADRATIFLRPRVVGRPLGADWAQATGLDALSAPGGTFAGLLDAPKSAVAKAPAAPSATATGGAPAAPAVERVIMLAPDGAKKAVRADQVEKAKAQGWRMP